MDTPPTTNAPEEHPDPEHKRELVVPILLINGSVIKTASGDAKRTAGGFSPAGLDTDKSEA